MIAGLTEAEKDVLKHLVSAWDAFLELRSAHPDDLDEFRRAVHSCQNLIAFRVASRAEPEIWWQPSPKPPGEDA